MSNKYQYEYKKFKSGKRRGQTYVNIRSVKTGKTIKTVSSKIGLQKAHKAVYQQKRRGKASAEKADVMKRMEREGAGGTYEEYVKEYKKELRNIPKRRLRDKTPPLSAAQTRSKAKFNVIQYKTGVACRYRYMWEYYQVAGTDKEGMDICDSSPVFSKEHLRRNGAEDYETMIEVCWDEYVRVREEACKSRPINGGAYVVLYDKATKRVLDEYELPEAGKGKGDLKFDFTEYNK